MESTDVSLIITVRNRAELLPLTLSHLELQSHPAAYFELLIVDMASTDNTQEVLLRYVAGAPVRSRCIYAGNANRAAALNQAARKAQGRWLLFLDDHLLAGPNLVESHIRAQERHGGNAAIVGALRHHPQIAANTLTRDYSVFRGDGYLKGQPLSFIDWRAWNLSLPRSSMLKVGGFDESFLHSGLEDIELAWRLEEDGVRGFYNDDATAYLWCPVSREEEQQRYYSEGYSLPMVLDKTRADVVRNRLLRPYQSGFNGPESILISLYRKWCGTLAADTHCFRFMFRRILIHSYLEGYKDALAGRPPTARGA